MSLWCHMSSNALRTSRKQIKVFTSTQGYSLAYTDIILHPSISLQRPWVYCSQGYRLRTFLKQRIQRHLTHSAVVFYKCVLPSGWSTNDWVPTLVFALADPGGGGGPMICSHDVRYTTRNTMSFQIFHKTVRLKRCLVPFNMQTKVL